jgi:hypothetical protein
VLTVCLTVTLYTLVLMLLGFVTAATVDREVWIRPVAGSPTPFPLALVASVLWAHIRRRAPLDVEKRAFCPPGCMCTDKLPPATQNGAGNAEADTPADAVANLGVVPGIRVPNAVERHSAIFIGFVMVDALDIDRD